MIISELSDVGWSKEIDLLPKRLILNQNPASIKLRNHFRHLIQVKWPDGLRLVSMQFFMSRYIWLTYGVAAWVRQMSHTTALGHVKHTKDPSKERTMLLNKLQNYQKFNRIWNQTIPTLKSKQILSILSKAGPWSMTVWQIRCVSSFRILINSNIFLGRDKSRYQVAR